MKKVTPLEVERIKASFRGELFEYINECLQYGLNTKQMMEITKIMREVADFADSFYMETKE